MKLECVASGHRESCNALAGTGPVLAATSCAYHRPIVHPAVPPAESRIRLGIMATHTREDLDRAIDVFRKMPTLFVLTLLAARSGRHDGRGRREESFVRGSLRSAVALIGQDK